MPRVKIVVGLCGSGKSHLARELGEAGYAVLDEDVAFTVEPGSVLSGPKFDCLLRRLSEGKDCAFTEALLMFKPVRELFMPCLKKRQGMDGVTVEWIFFENDLEAANHNCTNDPGRADGGRGHVQPNNVWSPRYSIPRRATKRAVQRVPPKGD
jgi:hypothetical protein